MSIKSEIMEATNELIESLHCNSDDEFVDDVISRIAYGDRFDFEDIVYAEEAEKEVEMSRSIRKNKNIIKQKNDCWAKRYHNKKIRRCVEILQGNAHKKIGDSYEICDYKTTGTAEFLKELKQSDIEEYHRLIGK